MGSDYRKLLGPKDVDDCFEKCDEKCPLKCAKTAPSSLGPPVITNGFLITGCMLGGVFFLCLVFMVVRRYVLLRRNRLRERSLPILFDTQQDFVDEDHGPVLDHPIWYINTVGLAQSVIDSITVCKYKRGDGLIEGTECSVCLSEFDEDESVRLLPKCSHAFHVSCIDTWLRSHKNCPLCRAPIVRENAGASASFRVSVLERNSSDSGLTEDTQMQNSENLGVTEGRQVEEGETSEVRIEDGRIHDGMIKNMSTSVVRSSGSRVLSDLGDNRERVGEETQVMRRSVSMDASSAEAIYRAVASVVSNQGISNSQLAVPVKGSNLVVLSKRASSIGISLQKGPTSLKRSFSSSRRFFTSKHRRSQSSILPS